MSLMILLDMIYDPDPATNRARVMAHVFREVLPRHLIREDGVITETQTLPQIPGLNFSNLRAGYYIPMQEAIVYLFANPWRAL
jgi:hypothetical protein